MNITTRKAFWAALLSLALASAIVALRLFPQAMPLLQIDLSMSRDQALAAAENLQVQRFAELHSTRAVARFGHDSDLQTYIELEGGGASAYSALLGQRFIAPYFWTVRRFTESQEDELSVRFTPEGHAYGFMRKVPERALGAALPEAAARTLAEAGARSQFGGVLWTAYAPLSASQVTRPGGRIDHSFVYEHQTERRGQARFRLRLVVAGDTVVEVTPYAYVPEAFAQRFTQLREGNETIANVAGIIMGTLFGMCGLLGGWIWLARRGGLAWRAALFASAVVGVLLAAATLSDLPLRWFYYTTTDSVSSFLIGIGGAALSAGVIATLFLGLLFAVANGLSQRAFASHPQVFSFWRVASAASPQALGRTLGGYAWTGIELLLVVGFYLVARTQWGWWLPAESLSDPNILTAWRPALQPIARALQAGTMEEALFRAVPLAAAALIGQWLGWRRSFIAVALVLQALVFAGAHANYPGLPSYSRVVELFLPALVWGLIFLRYGLVPCMLMHFTFDLTLMSLPLFVASDPRLWLDRALVLLAGLLPLLMLARARFKQGHFAELPAALRHGVPTVEPAPVSAPVLVPTEAQAVAETLAEAGAGSAALAPAVQPTVATPSGQPWCLRRGPLLIGAVLGALLLWLWQAAPVPTQAFTLDYNAAIARAEAVLAERGVQLDAHWKRLAVVLPVADAEPLATRFVWREAGPQMLSKLLDGGQLSPQQWRVMFRHPAGPVEERSENWEVALSGQGAALAVFHHIPEGRAGAKLTREQAQALVLAYMDGQKALANRPWELASAQEIERPARRDWGFRWDDKTAFNVKGASARVSINVRGDEIDAWQHIFVPDAWLRTQREALSTRTPYIAGALISGIAVLLLVLGTALRQVVQGTLRWRQGLTWALLFLLASLAQYLVTFDSQAMNFNVAQDWNTQLALGAATNAAGYLLGAALLGLLTMPLYRQQRADTASVISDLARGLALLLVIEGVAISLRHFLPDNDPVLPGVGSWSTLQPLLATALNGPLFACTAVAAVALTLGALHFCRTRVRAIVFGAICVALLVCATGAAETLGGGLALTVPALLGALTLGFLVRRGELGLAVALIALSPLAFLPKLLNMPIANAATHAALNCVVTLAMSWWALRYGRSLGHAKAPAQTP